MGLKSLLGSEILEDGKEQAQSEYLEYLIMYNKGTIPPGSPQEEAFNKGFEMGAQWVLDNLWAVIRS